MIHCEFHITHEEALSNVLTKCNKFLDLVLLHSTLKGWIKVTNSLMKQLDKPGRRSFYKTTLWGSFKGQHHKGKKIGGLIQTLKRHNQI